MITWRQIRESLDKVSDNRLDDPAVILLNSSEFRKIDLFEIEVPEIGDSRLVAIFVDEQEL